jgi:ERCC4-type nuclease
MSSVCLIVVDSFEPDQGVPTELHSLGVKVVRRRLAVGDYDLGSGLLVERKTVVDLHISLQRGRLWRQVGELRRASRLPYLLVEGHELDVHGAVSPNAIRGACLAVIGQGVPILRSDDQVDSARWLWLLARRVAGLVPGRDRPAYAQRLKPASDQVPEAMLAAVPGISVTGARALLERFGTVAGVVGAGHERWLDVPGVGPARAEALRRALF